MPSKLCESDVILTSLLKPILDKIAGVITSIINISLEQGVLAYSWKSAIVRPMLKKAGLALSCTNYRPVSNLPFLSKATEKCMLTQFTTHCDNKDLLPDYQSACLKNFSCETALVKLTDDILWSLEEQHVTSVVAIDLSAAFDTVDHGILLEVLQKRFGIEDTTVQWFDSYLRPQSLRANVGSEYSLEQLHFSVPKVLVQAQGFTHHMQAR